MVRKWVLFGEDELTADQIAAKFNRMPRRLVPIGCNHLTMFIDVQGNLLFYVIAAWEDDFTGYVLDYGTFPDQQRSYFTLRDARLTLPVVTKASGLEGAIYAGLERVTAEVVLEDLVRAEPRSGLARRFLPADRRPRPRTGGP